MNRDGLDASVKEAKKLEVEALEKELKEKERDNIALSNKDSYKMVMFVESKKIKRRIDQLKKQLAGMMVTLGKPPSADEASIRSELADKEAQLLYIEKFPLEEKFISILKTPTDELIKAKQDAIIARVYSENNYTRPTFRIDVEGTDNGEKKSQGHFLSSDEEESEDDEEESSEEESEDEE